MTTRHESRTQIAEKTELIATDALWRPPLAGFGRPHRRSQERQPRSLATVRKSHWVRTFGLHDALIRPVKIERLVRIYEVNLKARDRDLTLAITEEMFPAYWANGYLTNGEF
jgi:hypothetical protein